MLRERTCGANPLDGGRSRGKKRTAPPGWRDPRGPEVTARIPRRRGSCPVPAERRSAHPVSEAAGSVAAMGNAIRTTPPRLLDVTALFPRPAPPARTATRLRPRPGSPTSHDSSIGGPLLWPAGRRLRDPQEPSLTQEPQAARKYPPGYPCYARNIPPGVNVSRKEQPRVLHRQHRDRGHRKPQLPGGRRAHRGGRRPAPRVLAAAAPWASAGLPVVDERGSRGRIA